MVKTKLLTILLLIMFLMTGCDIGYMNNPQPEPLQRECEVLSVGTYMEISTSGWGAVIDQYPAYYFTYIDENGVLHSETIHHTEQGLWKVCIGEENKYVEKENKGSTYYYLYLTEETLKGMNNYEQRN
jgi:hypothetical protein